MRNILSGALALCALVCGTPSRGAADLPKRIYIAPDDHTDYMWAADEATYRQAFLDMLDYYLAQIDGTATSPPEVQGRWTCDCSLWVRIFEDNRPADAFARLISRIRDGHITVAMNTLVPCYGAQPAEAVLRGMFYAGSLERRFGLDLPIAQAMENQTLPFGLGALWSGSGVRYSWRGVCNCATQLHDLNDRAREIYWWTGLDGSRILMKWDSALGQSTTLGGYAEAYNPVAAINFVDSDPKFIQRYPYPVIGVFGRGWDALKTLTSEFLSAAATQSNAARTVIVSNERDFFEDFDATCGTQISSQSLAFGNEWDTYSVSMAEVSARVRRAVEKLRNAEALATLVSMKNQAFMSGREAARDLAWLDLGMYWDHDWTADGSISRTARAAWERRLAGEIEQYVDTLHADAAQALGAMISASPGVTRFYVFNALGWARTDQADLPWADTAPVQVYEVAGGKEVPSQIVTVDGQRCLRVLAESVPAVGYRVYEIRPSSGGVSFSDAATAAGSVLENAFYRVTLDGRGAITSLVDLGAGNREYAAAINGRTLNDLGPGTGSVAVEDAGPVSVTLKAVSADPVQHTTRVTLTRGLPRVAIRNDIEQNFSSVLTWGFGLNLASPEVNHEEVGAVIRARTTAQGGQYSTRNARYDWLSLGHFADMSAPDGTGLTLVNTDCCFMKLGNSTPTSLDTATPLIQALAGGQVDGPSYGIPSQGGDTHFMQRFALATHTAYNPAAAMRLALEAQNPLATGLVQGGSTYPADTFSLLTISNPDVLLWALKPAEDGIQQGIVARVWNMAGQAGSFVLNLNQEPISDASLVTHLEVVLGKPVLSNGKLMGSLATQQLKSYLIRPRSLVPPIVPTGISYFSVVE